MSRIILCHLSFFSLDLIFNDVYKDEKTGGKKMKKIFFFVFSDNYFDNGWSIKNTSGIAKNYTVRVGRGRVHHPS